MLQKVTRVVVPLVAVVTVSAAPLHGTFMITALRCTVDQVPASAVRCHPSRSEPFGVSLPVTCYVLPLRND